MDPNSRPSPIPELDTDGDGLRDDIELRAYGTNPALPDSDLDMCGDGHEAATVDGNRHVTAADLGIVASALGSYLIPYTEGDAWRVNLDVDKNSAITAADLGFIATRLGPCV
jgi:hypothetical protein